MHYARVKRLIDIAVSTVALVVLSPLLAIAAAGIWLSSPGPVIYRAGRAGLHGKVFTMYKFRTMHVQQGPTSSSITASGDPRVFHFGSLLRRLKLDELPQFLNILKGDMSVVGPRPEDPRIIREHYTPNQLETLRILPGLASPGSIYNYTHGEQLLDPTDPERCYVERLLPVKLALELVYLQNASLIYDLKIVMRTMWVIVARGLGRRHFPDPPEMKNAQQIMGSDGCKPVV